MVSKFQIAALCISFIPPDLNLSKLNPFAIKARRLTIYGAETFLRSY
jgi:hypothetical protein